MKNRRGQEEMVGFVVIMLLVAVIFLVFLGIYLRKGGSSSVESGEAAQFLDALEEVTTSCQKGFSYLNVRQLAKECYENNGGLCDSGENVCEVFKSVVKGNIEQSWTFDSQSRTKAYRFDAWYEPKGSTEHEACKDISNCLLPQRDVFLYACGRNYQGAEKAISERDGVIFLRLDICY